MKKMKHGGGHEREGYKGGNDSLLRRILLLVFVEVAPREPKYLGR